MRMFDQPIPGQSLTTEPKNAPWENPPEMNSVEEVTKMYIGRLANDEVIDDMVAVAEMGVPLKPIVESIYMQGVMKGIHTIDVGMLVAPVITEFLKQAIESYGVKVRVDSSDPEKKAKEAEMKRFQMLAMKYLKEGDMDQEDPGKQLLSELVGGEEEMGGEEMNAEEAAETPEFEQSETPEYEAAEEEAQPKGLMARGR